MLSFQSRTRLRPIIPELNESMMLWAFATSIMSASYVYILASARYGTLYIGVTSDLIKRVWQHREGFADGFTKQYNVKQLVWYETHTEIEQAIRREKQLKEWKRAWKLELINKHNPLWRDLYHEVV